MKVNKHQPDGHWQDVALIQFAHFSELFAKHFSWFSGEDLLIAVTGRERSSGEDGSLDFHTSLYFLNGEENEQSR